MKFRFFSCNGALLPASEALIPIENINLQYGFGVYESLKLRNSVLYFVAQHVDRLFKSAEIIGLEHSFVKDDVERYIRELVDKNELESCNIKMLLLGGRGAAEAALYILPLAPLFPDRKLYSHGATTSTVQYERFLPNAKTLNMLPSYLFYSRAKKAGHYDALFLDADRNILEGTRTNFFAINGKVLVTPPVAKVLEGVTRKTVIACAKLNGYEVREDDVPVDALGEYDGAFFTSTSSKIIPIVEIDGFSFSGISPELKELMKAYNAFLDASGGIFRDR